MRSSLLRGHLSHARVDEHRRRFRYPVHMACLDLDELPTLDHSLRLFSYNRPNLFSIHDRDYRTPLLRGDLSRVTLVTNLRTANYVFNPVSFFLGYSNDRLTTVIAEVNNNYGGRHTYVLDDPIAPGHFRAEKSFFVSPFIHGPAIYDFHFSTPFDIRMDVSRPDAASPFFVARLTGSPSPFTDRSLLSAAIRYPLMSVQVIALIYAEALYAHARGVPYRRP